MFWTAICNEIYSSMEGSCRRVSFRVAMQNENSQRARSATSSLASMGSGCTRGRIDLREKKGATFARSDADANEASSASAAENGRRASREPSVLSREQSNSQYWRRNCTSLVCSVTTAGSSSGLLMNRCGERWFASIRTNRRRRWPRV